MDLSDIITLIARWLHVLPAIFLLGSALYFKLALAPAAAGLPAQQLQRLYDDAAQRLKPWVWAAAAALVLAGFYNFFSKASHVPKPYHMWFGIKFMLALHVIVVSLLATKTGVDPAKRQRWMSGVVLTGVLTVAISGYLRYLAG
jgi:uncharacterized membrane protein